MNIVEMEKSVSKLSSAHKWRLLRALMADLFPRRTMTAKQRAAARRDLQERATTLDQAVSVEEFLAMRRGSNASR